MRTNLSLLLCAYWLSGSTAMALCLDGRHYTLPEEYQRSQFVFTGILEQAVDVSSPEDPQGIDHTLYTLKLGRAIKGQLPNRVIIRSDNSSSRFIIDAGAEYLLFMDEYRQEGFIDSCGNSGKLTPERAAFLSGLPNAG